MRSGEKQQGCPIFAQVQFEVVNFELSVAIQAVYSPQAGQTFCARRGTSSESGAAWSRELDDVRKVGGPWLILYMIEPSKTKQAVDNGHLGGARATLCGGSWVMITCFAT